MNKKRIFILVLCLLIWGFIFFYIVISENNKNRRSVTQYVLINPFNYWEYTNLEWKKIDTVLDFDYVDEHVNWQKFNIYRGNEYYKTLDFVYRGGEEFYFDDNSHSYEIPGEKILFNRDSYIKLVDFGDTSFNSEDLGVVDSFLKKYHYSTVGLTIQRKYIINSQDSLYVVSNYPSSIVNNGDNLFYIVFYRRNNKNYLLVNRGFVEDLSSYKLSWVLDIGIKNCNFILSYNCGEAICYDMYEYVKGKYIKVIGTNEE